MTGRPKHIPQRTCVVCREKDAKRSLLRFVRTSEGVFADATGKAEGRGAYVCDEAECRERAASGETLAKALRVMLNDADRQRIRQSIP